MDTLQTKQFTVYPPIKPSQCVKFRVSVFVYPTVINKDTTEIGYEELHPIVLYYVLHRVQAVDTESVRADALSTAYLNNFFSLLGVYKAANREIRSRPVDIA